jgi:uncharacterized membrane protein HdeD (DUF308 family)
MSTSLDIAAETQREAMRVSVKRYSLLLLSEGTLLALVGVLALFYSLLWPIGIAVPLGWMLIVSAVLQGIGAFSMRRMPHFIFQLVPVAIALIAGLLLLRDPQQSREALVALVLMFLTTEGVARIVFGLAIRPLPHWEWVMVSGVVGVCLAFVLLINMPGPATWLISVLVGVELIAEGAAIILLVWRVKGGETA